MIPANYHIHTYLCNHATGTIDDYINTAIEMKIGEIGFADHAPLPEHLRKGITMKPEETEFYISEIDKRKSLFKNRIMIRLGFEVDFPMHDSFDKKYLTDPRIDFLIGSCHFIDDWPFDHNAYIDEYERRDIDDIYSRYYKIMEALVDSKQFDIAGHFDIVKKFGHRPKKDFTDIIERISKKMSKFGLTAEINTSGMLKPVKEIYPSHDIIETFYRNNVPVTISSDSHSPELIGYLLGYTLEKIKKIGYKKISGFRKRKRYEIAI